ncbi:MAG: TetR/AcrR family transcriptional regulator [Runella sp.]
MTTKQKIIESALFLFNRFGFVSVRLQHIADETGLSVGNLAYHFKTKDDIIEHIYTEIVAEQQRLLADLRMIPLFVNLDTHLESIYQIQQQFSFFFTDTLEVMRAYPMIRRRHREHIKWQQIQVQLFIEFNVSRGAMKAPQKPDSFEQLAQRFVLLSDTWLSYEVMQGAIAKEIPAEQFKSALWSIFVPYFSEIGFIEYQQMKALPFDKLG